MATLAKKPLPHQDNDMPFPNPPSDGISSLAVNGTQTTPSSMVIAGSWDNGLHCYELQCQGVGGTLSNVIKQGQIMHEAPVLCCDIGPVSFIDDLGFEYFTLPSKPLARIR